MVQIENLFYASATLTDIHFKVISSCKGIRRIIFNHKEQGHNNSNLTRLHPEDPYMFGIFKQISEYFNLDRKIFTVPLDIHGTEFQLKVWDEVKKVPYGKTVSYKNLATRIFNPASVRAVGGANASNPVPVIIPCHRVIGNKGTLTGYSGGLELKERLLELEGGISLELFNILRVNHIELIEDY